MKIKRQDYWKEKGYTEEQIQNHLKFERYKSKQSRDRKKTNNTNNKEVIKQIKKDLVGNTFYSNRNDSMEILYVRPSTDGAGFWYKVHKVFSDKSYGDFRYFYPFDSYDKDEFIKDLNC